MVQNNEDISESCPGMYLLCLAMRFTKIPTGGKVSCMTPKLTIFWKKVLSGEPKLNFSGPAGGSRTTRVHSPSDTNVGAPVLLAQEEVRSTPPIQAATALKHASCDQKSLKNHKKNAIRSKIGHQSMVGGKIT